MQYSGHTVPPKNSTPAGSNSVPVMVVVPIVIVGGAPFAVAANKLRPIKSTDTIIAP